MMTDYFRGWLNDDVGGGDDDDHGDVYDTSLPLHGTYYACFSLEN